MAEKTKIIGAPQDLDLSGCSASADGGGTYMTLSQLVEKANTVAGDNDYTDLKTKVDGLDTSLVTLDSSVVKLNTANAANGYAKLDNAGMLVVGCNVDIGGRAYYNFGYDLDETGAAQVNPKVQTQQMNYYTVYPGTGVVQKMSEIVWNSGVDGQKANKAFDGTAFHPNMDGQGSLGRSTNAWNNIYAKTAPTITSDENTKTIVDTKVSVGDVLYNALSVKTFKLNEAVAAKGDEARIHTGFIAQDVEKALKDAGLDPSEMALWIQNDNVTNTEILQEDGSTKRVEQKIIDKDGVDKIQSLRYEEILCALFQGMKNEISKLKEQVSVLESKSGAK